MKFRHIIFIITLLNFSNVTNAQQNENKLSIKKKIPVTYAYQELFHSTILNEDRKINIFLPENFYKVSTQHKYPVLLLLEDEFFLMVSGMVKHLSSVERMPETIVVSLVDGPHTPKFYTNGSDFWPKDWKQLPFGGNPDSFTSHLKQELLPYLKNNFRTNGFTIVLGLSGTSMYALHTFAKEPDIFNAHIAIAAGDILGMGYKEGESLIDLFVNDFKNSPEKRGYLYVTSADSDSGTNSPMIKENLEELEKRLSPYRSDDFQFVSKIFPNEGHYDVALPALSEAFSLIFPKEKWCAAYRKIIKQPGSAMENIDNHFQELSTAYGFKILPRAERWNSGNSLSKIGPYLLRQGNIVESIEVIERWVAYRPKSTRALSKLAKAYEANNEFNKAILALEKAYKMSSSLKTKESNEYQTLINELKKKIKK
jgi:predicted alpha/beta superfamily hydrolase